MLIWAHDNDLISTPELIHQSNCVDQNSGKMGVGLSTYLGIVDYCSVLSEMHSALQ